MMFQHLKDANMTYLEHYFRAMKFAWWSMKLYFVCVLHAIFPWVFTDTFSENVLELAKAIKEEKNAKH